MKHLHAHHRKNDLCFAFLMAAVFAVMTAGAVAGTLDLARARSGLEAAKEKGALTARSSIDQEPRIAHSGARW
jgi:hypothetical protein